MKAKSFAGMRCSVAGALEMIGDRWTLLLLRDLGMGLSRFDEFQSSTGIANTTLATRLRNLERNGIIARTRYLERPPRDAYHLTDKGRDFWKVLAALREWGDRWDASGFGAPPIEVVDKDTDRKLRLALVDPQTGKAVGGDRIRYRPGPGADDSVRALLQRAAVGGAS
ncbi:MAG: helix-turn-helix domain-containing protein [Pseudomonadota bacterium]|uniref:winged helix-turn-helix transcriptional regulator n=1 Tax=Phenylobacterium sp. TaxID=1871053 RepID=UPI0025F4B213|nr:helix-turn-helix domain-containing protein [Phenylobacterium sp.]MBT9470233.1 helix-turn-helix transcriptional regulator [Phenylobacterium sp.]